MKKKILLAAAVLLTLGVGVASAQQTIDNRPAINLNWQDCVGSTLGLTNRTFACNTNGGNSTLITSFVPPDALIAVTGGDLVMDMQSSDAALHPLWDFGGCRAATALGFGTDFSGTPSGGAGCNDIFGPALGGGFNFPQYNAIPNWERFKHGFALADGFPAVAAGTETYFSRILISNAGSG